MQNFFLPQDLNNRCLQRLLGSGFETAVELAVIIIVIAWINRTSPKDLTTFTFFFLLSLKYP